jgi:hypothetical protein
MNESLKMSAAQERRQHLITGTKEKAMTGLAHVCLSYKRTRGIETRIASRGAARGASM